MAGKKAAKSGNNGNGVVTAIGEPTNGAAQAIESAMPFTAHITIVGNADLLFHGWDCAAVQEKADSKKGSATKKSDNLESYVLRNEDGIICLPAEYLRMSVVNAAKFRQDPRSPRKSAMDLFKAAVVSLSPLSPIVNCDGKLAKQWDFEHRCRAQIQRNGITRTRPAFHEGWSSEVSLMVVLPEYVDAPTLHEVVSQAGRLIGVGDFRPTFGRFQVTKFEVQKN